MLNVGNRFAAGFRHYIVPMHTGHVHIIPTLGIRYAKFDMIQIFNMLYAGHSTYRQVSVPMCFLLNPTQIITSTHILDCHFKLFLEIQFSRNLKLARLRYIICTFIKNPYM